MIETLWVVFSLAFVVALSGALAPGPLLTYTIVKTLETRRRPALTGVRVIAGHALLEALLVVGLLAGLSTVLRHPLTTRIIGAVGGLFLVVLGARLAVAVLRGRVRSPLAVPATGGGTPAPSRAAAGISNPVLGGILVTMSNPYWWVWWATIGLAFMARYEIGFSSWPLVVAFLLGHEAGDLAWYWAVSGLVSLGGRRLTDGLYRGVLVGCAVVMVGFGVFLGLSPYLGSTA